MEINMKETIMRKITYSVCVFFVTLALLMALLILASAIPNKWLATHQEQAAKILEAEGNYPKHFFATDPSQQDNFTDKIIIRHSLNDENDNALVAAMHKNYPRYWHGYEIYMRPLLVAFNLYQIRYLFMITYISLFVFTAILISRHIDVPSAVAFLFAIAMTYVVVVTTSLQFLPMFLICFSTIILELLFPSLVEKDSFLFYMVVGMVTSFVDLLTAPIITLGLPLIVFILKFDAKVGIKKFAKTIMTNSLFWGIGYACTWSGKWLIGSMILRENVLQSAADAISFRTMGNDDYAGGLLTDRFEAIRVNFVTMFSPEGKRAALFLFLLLAVFIVFAAMHLTKDKNRIMQAIGILFVGFYPYMWYFVLSNHSIIHHFFTFRAQAITAFAILACICRLTDWSRVGTKRPLR